MVANTAHKRSYYIENFEDHIVSSKTGSEAAQFYIVVIEGELLEPFSPETSLNTPLTIPGGVVKLQLKVKDYKSSNTFLKLLTVRG